MRYVICILQKIEVIIDKCLEQSQFVFASLWASVPPTNVNTMHTHEPARSQHITNAASIIQYIHRLNSKILISEMDAQHQIMSRLPSTGAKVNLVHIKQDLVTAAIITWTKESYLN